MSNNTDYFNKVFDHPLDKGQSEACFRLENCVVAAGAGSGKTQVLASRFAYLIMECNVKVDQILALTFTKKAANEIYQRVFEILSKFAFSEICPETSRKKAMEALKDFDKARISTLDSYSGSIVRKGAVLYGIKPDFSSDGDTSFIDSDAIRFVLNHREDPCINYFTEPGSIQKFAQDIFAYVVKEHSSICCSQHYFEDFLEIQKNEILEKWGPLTASVLDGDALSQDLQNPSLRTGKGSYEAKLDERFNEVLSAIEKYNPLEKSRTLTSETFLDFSINETDILDSIIEICDTAVFSPNRVNEKYKEFAKNYTACAAELKLCTLYIKDFYYTKQLLQLLDQFTQEVNEKKRTLGSLTFNDINNLALKILCEQETIRNEEKRSVKKIMIDEFQDNNGKNRDLLYLISEKDSVFSKVSYEHPDMTAVIMNLSPDKLFFVGDEKQSIYKFRGADVSVFNSLEQDLKKTTNKPVRLSMTNNYRSTKTLLAAFNKLFGDIGQKKQDGLKLFVKDLDMNDEQFHAYYTLPATYKDTELTYEDVECNLTKENVPIHTVFYDKNASKKMLEELGLSSDLVLGGSDVIALSIAKQIQDLHQKGVDYSDIAVLDKSRTHRSELCRWLNLFHIPYNTDAESSVFSDSLINDIYYYLRFYVYPQDIQAFASYLHSPLAGLTLSSIEKLLSAFSKQDSVFLPFSSENMETAKNLLSESEYEKYETASKLYNTDILSNMGLCDLMSYLWNHTGYRYESLLDTTVNQSARQFDLLFELARKCEEDGRTITWFVDELAVAREKEFSSYGQEDSEIDVKEVSFPLEQQDSVNILTIHKSKGLQYKYVLIDGILNMSKKDTEAQCYFDDTTGLSFKHGKSQNYFFQKNKTIFDRMSDAEMRRIIYVAITRAEKEVWIYSNLISQGELCKQILSNAKAKTVGYYDYPDFEIKKDSTLQSITEPDFYSYDGCPTDLKRLKPVLKEYLNSFSKESQEKERLDTKEKLSSLLYKASVIDTEKLPQDKITPSSLEMRHKNETGLKIISGTQIDAFTGLSQVMNDQKNYGYDDFGTLAHRYLELSVNKDPDLNEKIMELQKDLNDENFRKLLQACHIMKDSFFESDLGKEVLESNYVKTEYAFKMLYEDDFDNKDKICTGTIDLFFKNKEGGITIVDYKTDGEMCPDLYKEQQAAYKKAVSLMYNIEETAVKTRLFFLRYGKEVEL